MSSANPKRAVLQLAIAFFLVFLAFGPVQNLESTLNSDAGLGATSLGVLYFSLGFFSLFTARLVSRLGTRATLVGGLSTYSTFVAAHWWPGWTTFIPASALLGFGASLVWVAQGTYVSLAARSYAGLQGVPQADALAQFNGMFYGIFQSTQVFGNAISMWVLRDASGHRKDTVGAPADDVIDPSSLLDTTAPAGDVIDGSSSLIDGSTTDMVDSSADVNGPQPNPPPAGGSGDPRQLIAMFLAFTLAGVVVAYFLPSLTDDSHNTADDTGTATVATTRGNDGLSGPKSPAKGGPEDENEEMGGDDHADDHHLATHSTPLLGAGGSSGSISGGGPGWTGQIADKWGPKETAAGGNGAGAGGSGVPPALPTSHGVGGVRTSSGKAGGSIIKGVASQGASDWWTLALLVPIMGYSGAQGAFIWGDFTRDIVASQLGVPWVGGVMAVFGATDAMASFAVGQLRGKGSSSLAASIVFAALSQLVLLWVIFLRSVGGAGAGQTWQVFLIAGIWGCGDGIWNTQLSAMLGGMFVHSTERAFAVWKFCQSVATACQCFLSPHILLLNRIIVLSVAIVVALVCYAPVAIKGAQAAAGRHKLKAAQV